MKLEQKEIYRSTGPGGNMSTQRTGEMNLVAAEADIYFPSSEKKPIWTG